MTSSPSIDDIATTLVDTNALPAFLATITELPPMKDVACPSVLLNTHPALQLTKEYCHHSDLLQLSTIDEKLATLTTLEQRGDAQFESLSAKNP